MRGTPPPGFVDFVVARGPSLHRTAILLTRDHHRAEDLVQTALARAWGSWDRVHSDHEAYVRRILVNEFASSWRRRWNDERPSQVLPEVATADHGDAVTDRLDAGRGTRPAPPAAAGRGGAAVLPRLLRGDDGRRARRHRRDGQVPDLQGPGHPAGESRPARSGRPRGRPLHQRAEEPAMSHTLDDLRGALAEAVDGVAGPTPEATLEGTGRHRAAASRRRRTGVAALTVAVLAAGGALATRAPEHRAGPVQPAVRTVTDGSFPTYRDGLHLVRVYDVPVGSAAQRRPLAVPAGMDGDVWVQVQCPDVPGRASRT